MNKKPPVTSSAPLDLAKLCPRCNRLIQGPLIQCEACGYGVQSASPKDRGIIEDQIQFARITRPWILSRVLLYARSTNALGAIELMILFAPVLFWVQPIGTVDNRHRALVLLAGIAAAGLDIWWRATSGEPSRWRRAIFPGEGGSFLYVPGWLFGISMIVLVIVALITVPAGGGRRRPAPAVQPALRWFPAGS